MAAVAAGSSLRAKARLRDRGDEAAPSTQTRDIRRRVAFDGFGVLQDGTSFRLSMVDLSYDGCRIATEVALFPGLKFRLALHRFTGTEDVRVMWHKDGHAGVKFSSSGEQSRSETPRAHERLAVESQVMLRRRGRKAYQGRLFDLSPAGCKVECVERPRPGELMWAKFAGLDAVEAEVRWVDGFRAGLKFARSFHPAMFDFVVAKLGEPASASI